MLRCRALFLAIQVQATIQVQAITAISETDDRKKIAVAIRLVDLTLCQRQIALFEARLITYLPFFPIFRRTSVKHARQFQTDENFAPASN